MRLGGLVTLAVLVAPVALALGPGAAQTDLLVRHDATGWASVALDAAGGFTMSVRVKNMSGEVAGVGVLAYDADDTYVGGNVWAADALDSYAAGQGFNYEWIATPDGGALATVRWACGACVGAHKLVFWLAGEAAWWEHRVQSAAGFSVGASHEGARSFALHSEDFGAAEAPLLLGYAALDTTTTIEAEHTLLGAFPSFTSYWDDDLYGATYRDLSIALPEGATWTCGPLDANCMLRDVHGAGDYDVRVTAAGAGLAYLPILFTGADVRLPE